MFNYVFSTLAEMFSYTFLVRAFVVGALVSICAALLGVSLVLKRYSMIGDGLSHVGFGALAIATALNAAPLAVSIPLVLAAAFMLLRLGEKHLLKGDAAIALISTGSLALGVVIISQTTGMNTDVCNYLFGSILAMNKSDVYLSIALSIVVLVLFVLFYHKLFALVFDETFAKTAGVKTGLFNMLIAFLTAVIIVLGMRLMGAMLISALIIFPALTSMRIFKKFRSVTVCSVCVSILCFFTGIIISYVYAVPTGASVVLVNIAAFVIFCVINVLIKENAFLKPGFVPKSGVILLVIVPFIISCGNNSRQNNPAPVSKSDTVIEIKEKMFIAQTNDVYLNPGEYLGKTIKLEGLFTREQYTGDALSTRDCCFVLRYGPGCCGNDGNAGFEVAWSKDVLADKTYPATDDAANLPWVEVSGVLKTYEEDGNPFLFIELASLTVKDKRGAEFVTQ